MSKEKEPSTTTVTDTIDKTTEKGIHLASMLEKEWLPKSAIISPQPPQKGYYGPITIKSWAIQKATQKPTNQPPTTIPIHTQRPIQQFQTVQEPLPFIQPNPQQLQIPSPIQQKDYTHTLQELTDTLKEIQKTIISENYKSMQMLSAIIAQLQEQTQTQKKLKEMFTSQKSLGTLENTPTPMITPTTGNTE